MKDEKAEDAKKGILDGPDGFHISFGPLGFDVSLFLDCSWSCL